VERLPRDANGKLPQAALAALYAAHRAAAASEAVSMDCVFSVAADHPALPGHFPGNPVVPGVLVLDHVMARLRACTGREVTGLPRVKFSAPLLPGEAAEVRFQQRAASVGFRVSTQRAGSVQLIAEGSLVLEAAP
jgi:3-hydroxymyristoyl/3-hydroxydecanoyl-(acyl carrier protein) dehydratase